MARQTREAGRFVTLRSGRVIFIPKGYKGRWADVRDKIKTGVGGPASMKTGEIKGRIASLAAGYDHEWDGKLYRSGSGSFFAVDRENAEMYEMVTGEPVKTYDFPSGVERPLFLDLEGEGTIGMLEGWSGKKYADVGDVALMVEESLPSIEKEGYDSVVIRGETGAEIWGTPVEFVDLKGKVGA